MKNVLFISVASAFLALLSPVEGIAFGIVDRSASRDTLSIPFQALDSLGRAADLTAGDSVYLTVFSPGGTVVYRDSMAHDDASITFYDWEAYDGGRHYVYAELVSILDGQATAPGLYSYILAVDDNTGADLITSYFGQFQIVNSPLESSLDSAGVGAVAALAAVDSIAVALGTLTSLSASVSVMLDSLSAIIDSLKSQANWVGTLRGDSTEEVIFKRLAIRSEDDDTAFLVQASGTGVGFWASGGPGGGADIQADIVGTITPQDTNASGQLLAVMPPFWSAGDTTAYQGEASGLTAGSVADAVWDEEQSEHTGAGTFGRFLDAAISGLGSGSGLYAVTVQTIDSSADQAIPHVRLAVRNLEQTTLIATGLTDGSGKATFNLDADSYIVLASATGYLFEAYDTLVVTEGTMDSVYGTGFDPGTPASPDLCRVFGFVTDLGGRPEIDATVSAYLPRGVVRAEDIVVSPFAVTTTTDTSGYFFLDLIPSDVLIGDDTRYEISINRRDGTILRKRFTVPEQSSWQIIW